MPGLHDLQLEQVLEDKNEEIDKRHGANYTSTDKAEIIY